MKLVSEWVMGQGYVTYIEEEPTTKQTDPSCTCNAAATGRTGHRNWCERLKEAVRRGK